MCLAIPSQITQLLPDHRALVSVGGMQREISTILLDSVSLGDYVIVHVGYALTRLDPVEAKRTLQLFAELAEQTP